MPLLEWIRRLLATVHSGRPDHDLEAELRAHLELAEEDARRRGLTGLEARRAARLQSGGLTQALDAVRDRQRLPWLDAITADVVFGWRQLRKHRVATLAAVLSLGLAIGATAAAFRLVDAVLLRPLPVSEPGRLFALAYTMVTSQGEMEYRDEFDYPTFRRYRDAAGSSADLMVVGMSTPQQIAFNEDLERASRQYFSGNVFAALGLQPALGRLLGPNDDRIGEQHVAVISHEYWSRRFDRDPTVIGRVFRWGRSRVEIVGVAPKGFTGTEPGHVTDFFVPAAMNNDALDKVGWSWFRTWIRPHAGVSPEQVRQRLQPVFVEDHKANAKTFPPNTPRAQIDAFLSQQLQLVPAGSGTSTMQRNLQRPLLILSGLVVLVLIIACANVANLLAAQSIARGREMALRVSIGAGRSRLIHLVLVESALLAVMASVVGAVFAWWAAPFVVSLVELEQPVRLMLDIDWRTLAFGGTLTTAVAFLFGIAPALRAASVDPLRTLKGSHDPHAHGRLTRSIVALQMAFCVFVLFAAGLFMATFDRLSRQPLGFVPQRLLVLETEAARGKAERNNWNTLIERMRSLPGIESAALAGWAPLTGNRWTSPVSIPGGHSEDRPPYFLDVSPRYFTTMRTALIEGRDFHGDDGAPSVTPNNQPVPGVAIVNRTFARLYFGAESPIGKRAIVHHWKNVDVPMQIVGVAEDAVYRTVREPVPPTVYVPLDFHQKSNAALLLRTTGDPLPLAAMTRREAGRASTDFRISNVATQGDYVRRQIVLERLVALLSSFFAVVALLLSAIGLYSVLNAAVSGRRREIGIRVALGARAAHVVRRVTGIIVAPVGIGLTIGLGAGVAFGELVERLLFQIKATDPASVLAPLTMLLVAAVGAALPPVIRAIRIDPTDTLRSE